MSDPLANPLLEIDELPRFDAITPALVAPAVERCLGECRDALAHIVGADGVRSFNGVALAVEHLSDRLSRTWSPVRHLHAVADTPQLRAAYEAALPLITEFQTDLTQNRALYEAYQAVAVADGFEYLSQAERRVVDNALRAFRLGGVSLEGPERDRFKRNATRLAELSSQFSNNVLDATRAWHRDIDDEAGLAGLPESARSLARQTAEQAGQPGWRFTLDMPLYLPVASFADDRALREEMYLAYVTRASERGPSAGHFDNTPLMGEILSLRAEQAELLGFESYAHLSLDRKMAASPDEVMAFLRDLAKHSRPVAERELAELEQFAREEDGLESLEAWDIAYYAERLKSRRFDYSQEDLRPYFPLPRVIHGLFEVASRLFNVRLERAHDTSVWHEDVQFYRVLDAENETIGELYLDLYARPGKRGGAWMDVCRSRSDFDHVARRPVAFLTCNFTPPINPHPALITHDEVTTLFHEFGHGLHHLLTRVTLPSVSGISGVEWDAVELPSQFLENWCYQRDALSLLSAQHDSGEPLPDSLFEKLRASRNFHSGLKMLRQLEFALFDFRLHLEHSSDMNVLATLDEVRKEVAVAPTPEFNRFANSFGHIFAGGYAAGYYSYKWAEVLASDAFACFEEAGIFNAESGQRFRREILERGGTRDAMDSFVAFRGRRPDISALLRHAGIEPEHSVDAA